MASRRGVLCCCGTTGGPGQNCNAHFNACAGPPPVVISFQLTAFYNILYNERVGIHPNGTDICQRCPWRETYSFRASLTASAIGVWSSTGQGVVTMNGTATETIVQQAGGHYCPDPCSQWPGCFPYAGPCVTERWQYSIPIQMTAVCAPPSQQAATGLVIEGGNGYAANGGTYTTTVYDIPYCGGSGTGQTTTTTTPVNAGLYITIVQRGCTSRPVFAISRLAPTPAVPTPNYVVPAYSERTDSGTCAYTVVETGGTCVVSYASAVGIP